MNLRPLFLFLSLLPLVAARGETNTLLGASTRSTFVTTTHLAGSGQAFDLLGGGLALNQPMMGTDMTGVDFRGIVSTSQTAHGNPVQRVATVEALAVGYLFSTRQRRTFITAGFAYTWNKLGDELPGGDGNRAWERLGLGLECEFARNWTVSPEVVAFIPFKGNDGYFEYALGVHRWMSARWGVGLRLGQGTHHGMRRTSVGCSVDWRR